MGVAAWGVEVYSVAFSGWGIRLQHWGSRLAVQDYCLECTAWHSGSGFGASSVCRAGVWHLNSEVSGLLFGGSGSLGWPVDWLPQRVHIYNH